MNTSKCRMCNREMFLEYNGLCRGCYKNQVLGLTTNMDQRKLVTALFLLSDRAMLKAKRKLLNELKKHGFKDKQVIKNIKNSL